MRAYTDYLREQNITVKYIKATEKEHDIRELFNSIKDVDKVYYADVCDDWLEQRITRSADKYDIEIEVADSPGFLNSRNDANKYHPKRDNYFHHDYYVAERKKRNILLNKDNSPKGGKWSFDEENRRKLPKEIEIPAIKFRDESNYIEAASRYVTKHFKDNPGTNSVQFGNDAGWYPVTHEHAAMWLDDFLKERFKLFGKYEDAIAEDEQTVFHSVLTPMLNIGLLTPRQVLDKALKYADKHQIPMNSLEGFIRQIIGWREFMRIIYLQKGKHQRVSNYWGFQQRKIPSKFYTAETGIYPVDNTIEKVLKTGYAHHIERLMILGNFMLLCEIHPNEVYKWFMELFIDAYDWVMVPNVYGMSQYADGGLMTTKPYVSGSNYIKKMSDYKNGDWQEVWDALYWRFIAINEHTFSNNHRMSIMTAMWNKMDKAKQDKHMKLAESYLKKLWSE